MSKYQPQFNMRMPEDLKSRLKRIADADDRSLTYVVIKCLELGLEQKETGQKVS